MTDLRCTRSRAVKRDNCLGSTCMKWMPNGELSGVDLNLIMERLATVDSNLSVMGSCHLDETRG